MIFLQTPEAGSATSHRFLPVRRLRVPALGYTQRRGTAVTSFIRPHLRKSHALGPSIEDEVPCISWSGSSTGLLRNAPSVRPQMLGESTNRQARHLDQDSNHFRIDRLTKVVNRAPSLSIALQAHSLCRSRDRVMAATKAGCYFFAGQTFDSEFGNFPSRYRLLVN